MKLRHDNYLGEIKGALICPRWQLYFEEMFKDAELMIELNNYYMRKPANNPNFKNHHFI